MNSCLFPSYAHSEYCIAAGFADHLFGMEFWYFVLFELMLRESITDSERLKTIGIIT